MSDQKWKEIQQQLDDLKSQQKSQCPNCGYCPSCGRGYHVSPYQWPHYPSYPYPYITYGTYCGTVTTSTGTNVAITS